MTTFDASRRSARTVGRLTSDTALFSNPNQRKDHPMSATETLGALADKHNVTLEPQLARDLEIPVLTGPQVQGDVIILPIRAGKDIGQPIPAEGVPVVRGENGGNTHLVVGDGTWRPIQDAGRSTDLGVLTVPAGGEAFILHPEHGANAMGPGSYMLRRQQEMADQIRQVAD